MAEDINQSESNMNFENDPDYGLPQVTLTPIERGGIGRRKGTVRSGNRKTTNQEKKSNTPLIISLLFVFLLVLAALWYFFGQDMFGSDPVGQQTDNVENTAPDNQDSTPIDTSPDTGADDDSQSASSLDEGGEGDISGGSDSSGDAALDDDTYGTGLTEQGTFNVINERTGRTYVIVGSFFDEDLAKDYAAKLGKQGISTNLIMPSGGKRFYRLSIADFDTITEAINNLEGFRADHGGSLWIIKH